MSPDRAYDDLTQQELTDEIRGLDTEIESCQNSLAKLRKELKQKTYLRESLIEICARKTQVKGWRSKT